MMPYSERFQFFWKIENFSMLPHPHRKYLESAVFSTQIFPETNFCLRLYPRGYLQGVDNCMSCFFWREKTDASPTEIGFSLTLESVDDFKYKDFTIPSFKLVRNYGWPNIVQLKYLNENKSNFLPRDVLTIRCQVWVPENKAKASKLSDNFIVERSLNQCTSLTQIQVSKQYAIWPIAGINKLLKCKEKVSFLVDYSIEMHPSFKLSFFLNEDSNSEYAQIEITQTKSILRKTSIFVKCKITVKSARKEYQHSQTDTFSFDSDAESVWRFPQFIEITNLEEEKYIHLDDTLYLSCEFSFTTEGDPVYHIEVPRYIQSTFEVPKSSIVTNLSNKISKLYWDSQFCDVTLKVDKKTFLAYKVVLCAQSPVFRAMFRNDMKENNTNVIEVTDVDVDTMEQMLDFLHSDTLKEDLSTEDICKLYSAADKYQILHFKQKCTSLLLSTLSVAEVCKVLIIADRHQDDFMMSFVHDFVKYHATEIFHSSQWEEFINENPILSGRIMLQVWKST